MTTERAAGSATVSADALHAFCVAALTTVGVGDAYARTTADVLVTTDTWGVFTHGVKALRGYVPPPSVRRPPRGRLAGDRRRRPGLGRGGRPFGAGHGDVRVRHADGDGQGAGVRRRLRRRPQQLPLRRGRLLREHGRVRGHDRPGDGQRHPQRHGARRPRPRQRQQPVGLRRADLRRQVDPAGHGDERCGRRQGRRRPRGRQADPRRLGGGPRRRADDRPGGLPRRRGAAADGRP